MAQTYYDHLAKFDLGVNSGVSALDLPLNQLAFGLNTTVRGGYAHPRPPFMRQTLDFGGDAALQLAVEKGFFQGATQKPYKPDFGPSSHIAQISGRLFKFTPAVAVRTWTVTEITIPGDPNDATTGQVWMWQAEKWLIITDGSPKFPIFYDNETTRRSYGPSITLGEISVGAAVPDIGQTVTVTLTAPYTGPFDVPVFLNGFFYQPIANPAADPTYDVILTNVSDLGIAHPSGVDVSVIPGQVGRLARATVFGPGVYPPGDTLIGEAFNLSNLLPVLPNGTMILVTNSNNVQFQFKIIGNQVGVIYPGTTGYSIEVVTGILGPNTFPLGAMVQLAGAVPPATIVGQTTAPFVPPAQGATVNVTLNAQYSGAANQAVWVENQQYLINPAPPPAPSATLTLVNLTDPATVTPLVAGQFILSIPELPPGRMGAYGMNHVAMSLVDGKSFIYGDVAGGPSGTPANNYRDAVLKTTESDLLAGQGAFRIPNSGEIITAMTFPANLDAALGQGPLQVGTPVSMFSCLVTNVRTEWPTLSGPILPMSLKGKGPLAQNSTGSANSDTIFRSYDGIGSLILARRDFQDSWGNTTISREMERILFRDNQSLLSYGSQANFDNRRLDTCSPQVSNQGVFHVGQTAINFDPVSNLHSKSPSVWDGVFTGINVLQFNVGEFDSVERCLPFVYNFTEEKIELWELLKEGTDEYLDNGETPILWLFETAVLFHPDKRPITVPFVQLKNGKIYLQEMKGNINVKVYWRPLFFPCWSLWHERDICVQTTGDEIKPGYMTIGLGEPPINPCDDSSGVPLKIGRGHQLRIEIIGQAKYMGGDFLANDEVEVTFPAPVCDAEDCRVIQCEVPDDLRQYSLSGLQPLPLPPNEGGLIGNAEVYYDFPCEDDPPPV